MVDTKGNGLSGPLWVFLILIIIIIAENPAIGEESHHVAWEIRQGEKGFIVNQRNCALYFFTLGSEVHGIK